MRETGETRAAAVDVPRHREASNGAPSLFCLEKKGGGGGWFYPLSDTSKGEFESQCHGDCKPQCGQICTCAEGKT